MSSSALCTGEMLAGEASPVSREVGCGKCGLKSEYGGTVGMGVLSGGQKQCVGSSSLLSLPQLNRLLRGLKTVGI